MSNVAAVIITYNIGARFKTSIEKIINQVSEIIIVDNGSNIETLKILDELEDKITLIKLSENKGIAYALNRGIEYAIDKAYEWVLTLDHDSVATDNMVFNMIDCYSELAIEYQEKIAMLVPTHVEESSFNGTNSSASEYEEVLTEITSGAMVKGNIYKTHGLYDEKLFIDLVDHDYCLSLNKSGYKIIEVKSAILLHNLGESVSRKVLGKSITCTNHSALRRYYMTRNRMYIWKKYKNDFLKWTLLDKRRFLTENLKIVLFEENKVEKIKLICRGIKDYKNDNFGPYKK